MIQVSFSPVRPTLTPPFQVPRRRVLRAGIWATLCLLFVTQAAQAEPVYSKSPRFRIPFQFDATELERLGAREVRLFVTRDKNNRWEMVESVSPQTGHFTFQAPADGTYAFSIKTIAASGLEYPAGPHQVGLTVIVDSHPPTLELKLEEIEPGRVRLAWRAEDANLDLTTLRLEYSDPDTSDFQPVSIRTEKQGQTSWTLGRAGLVQVRGTVADVAGQTATETAEVTVTIGSPDKTERAIIGQPVANAPVSTDPLEGLPKLDSRQSAGQSVNSRLTSAPAGSPKVMLPGSPETTPGPTGSASEIPALDSLTPPEVTGSTSPSPAAANHGQKISPASPPAKGADPKSGHLVNSTTFRIAYELEGVGVSGISSVELYITENDGRKWYHYGRDPDRTSPMEVTVPQDGSYGFSFRVVNGLGLASQPPQPGDAPEVRVTVDRVAPVVSLIPTKPGQGMAAGRVVIEWTAEDRHLPSQPVSLSYSTQPNGPWQQIDTWQQNTGRYVWTVPESLTERFYICLDVRDEAGNATRVVSDEPYLIDRARPKARVTEIESLKSGLR